MPSARLLVLALGATLLVASLSLAARRILQLERLELEHVSPWNDLAALQHAPGATRISVRITEVELRAGEDALFELCARDPLTSAAFRDALELVVWQPSAQRLELKVPLDAPHLALVKRTEQAACLTLGGGRIAQAGTYALDAVWAGRAALPSEVKSVPLQARVLAKPPLSTQEGLLVWCAGLGGLLCVFAGFAPHAHAADSPRHTAAWALAGTVLAGALTWGALHVPLPGSLGGYARGLGLALVQLGIAWGGARWLYRAPRAGLGLSAPTQRAGMWLFMAVAAALALRPLALWAMRVVPASGEAPIQTFISWPSGALAFAALGMAVPLAEEVFFRGFVFGALRPLGASAALLLTTLLFASVHAPQTWGNWGALLSVTATGAVLTALRALSGSTLVPAVAHLLYNLSLWTDSFQG